MRYITLLAVALMLSASCAPCQTIDRSADDTISSALRELVVSSSEDLKSYTFFLEMEQNMQIMNQSTDQSQQILTKSIGFGLANMTSQALKIVMASLTFIQGDETNSTALALEEYLQNDTIYVKIEDNWTALQLYGLEDAWSQQNALEQQIDLFNQSHLTLIGSEVVDGDECYRVRADIDISSYADPLSEEMAMYIPFLPTNSSEIFRNMTLNVDYWISKESHLLRRADVSETLNLTPRSLGFTGEEDRDLAIHIRSNTSIVFGGFNEALTIVIPAEAKSALPFPRDTYPESTAAIVSDDEDLDRALENGTMTDEYAAASDSAASNSTETRRKLADSIPSNMAADGGNVPGAADSAMLGDALPAALRD